MSETFERHQPGGVMSKRDIKAKRWLRKKLNGHYGRQWEWSRALAMNDISEPA